MKKPLTHPKWHSHKRGKYNMGEKEKEKQPVTEDRKDLYIVPQPTLMFYSSFVQIEALEKKMAEVIDKHNRLVDLIAKEAK